MRSKPAEGFAILSLVGVLLAPPALAQETPAPPEPQAPSPTPAPETPKKEEGFFKKTFGDRFALFLEVAYGEGSTDPTETTVKTGLTSRVVNEIEIDDLTGGRLTVGWTLPEDKGRVALTMNGFAENSFTFSGTGYTALVVAADNAPPPTGDTPVLSWWTTRVESGHVKTQRNPPIWTDDPLAPDSQVDPGEISYAGPDLTLEREIPESLQNRAQTWDLYYQRDFGGRRYSGRWTAGARYFVYDGNMPSAAWLIAASAEGGAGYSDGFAIPVILTRQETTGWGPSGSAEFQMSFARKRLVLYLRANVAFLMESLSADTGDFFTFVRKLGTTELVASPVSLQKDLEHSAWQMGGEAGVRGRVAPGFDIYLAWSLQAYTDAILYPIELLIPDNPVRIPLGTSALYKTRDIVYDQVMLGLAFQF